MVFVNRIDYFNKMNVIIRDISKFCLISLSSTHDRTHKLELKLQKQLLELYKGNLICKKTLITILDLLVPKDQDSMGCLKFTKTMFLYIILSMMGSVQHELAKWLSKLIKPVSDYFSTYCVSDFLPF